MTTRSVPPVPRWLGLAGLLPQIGVVVLLLSHDLSLRVTALAIAHAYAALILSFLGGLWWGLAAAALDRAPRWLWFASVAPSLIALATALPWAMGDRWSGSSLTVLGLALIGSLAIDRHLERAAIAPGWWMTLRLPLSLGLGVLTLLTVML